jgi:hypothetical protein
MFSLNDLATISGVSSRSVTAENPTGAPGSGGTASSALGVGRKGRPAFSLEAGGTIVLADVEGPGVIRHIWMTVPDKTPSGGPFVLRDLILRVYWDDEETPSIEAPLGDFFCSGFGLRASVTSMPIVVAPTGGMNCYFPMPFRKKARFELTSEHAADIPYVFVQIDYTVGDELPEDVGYFHAQWRRTNGDNALGEDHVLLDGVRGPGKYVGSYIALSALERFWWGEGEVKFYIDGDTEFPTICGTGLEDYVGGSWAFQNKLALAPKDAPVDDITVHTFSAPFLGYPTRLTDDTTGTAEFDRAMPPGHGMYRWHIPDPIHFRSDLRVTLQQLGADSYRLFERRDDISTVAYWYQTEPHGDFPEFPVREERRPR